jgi:biopolymer transport protein ExbD
VEFHRTARKPVTVSIVPLIDILVTLLFFFIVTMNDLTEKTPRPEIQVSLPSAHSLKVKATDVTRSTLSVGKDGGAELDGLKIPEGLLKEYLIANLEKRPGFKLALRFDRGCPVDSFLYTNSAALDAGYAEKDIYILVDKPQVAPKTP